jgi:hypothetical protein
MNKALEKERNNNEKTRRRKMYVDDNNEWVETYFTCQYVFSFMYCDRLFDFLSLAHSFSFDNQQIRVNLNMKWKKKNETWISKVHFNAGGGSLQHMCKCDIYLSFNNNHVTLFVDLRAKINLRQIKLRENPSICVTNNSLNKLLLFHWSSTIAEYIIHAHVCVEVNFTRKYFQV